jgi:hypothetical protein
MKRFMFLLLVLPLIYCAPGVEPITDADAELSLELENMLGVSDSTRTAYLKHMKLGGQSYMIDTTWIREAIRLELQMAEEYKADLIKRLEEK